MGGECVGGGVGGGGGGGGGVKALVVGPLVEELFLRLPLLIKS